MRIIIIIVMLMFCNSIKAANVRWTGIQLTNNNCDTAMEYDFGGFVYGENDKGTWILTHLYGHMENDGLHLKHEDFSVEMMNPTFNWWALALYGDIVSEATFTSLNQIELSRWPDLYDGGGTLVENPTDFYMAFKVSEVLLGSTDYEEGMSWYGWVHVSVDENLQMTLLDEGINLYGGAVMVGMGIPEPSGGMLLLIGVAVLGLRRVKEL